MLTYAEAFANWKAEILPAVVAHYGRDDIPAISESWNNYTNGLFECGEFTGLQYHYCPSWDDDMPDSDHAFILYAMGLRFSETRVRSRPDGFMWKLPRHWRYLLQRNGAEMDGYYSGGSAITECKIDAVFYCLLSDADAAEYLNFEEWASNYGYDSRAAERIYMACIETADRLKLLFSESELSDLRELFADY